MANIRVTCPACKSELEIDETFEGEEVECGNCLEVFRAKRPGSTGSSGAGKSTGAGASGSGRRKPADKPAPKKKRRRDDDDDYEHDHRSDDWDDDDYAPPPARRRDGGGDGLAITSLILGILAIFPGCCCALLAGPLGLGAVITGAVGMKSANNKGMAVAGLVLGALALCWAGFGLFLGFGNAFMNPQQRFR